MFLNAQWPWLYNILVVLFSAGVSFFAIPSIIFVANTRHLYDDLDQERKNHDYGISRLGGIAIFCAFTIVSLLFARYDDVLSTNLLLTSCIILFAVGLKDDLAGTGPATKFIVQFIVALILVCLADVRLSSLYGVLGIWDIGYYESILLSVLIIMFFINAFNLIDGIDGLAGSIGIVVNLTFAVMFMHMGELGLAILACSLVGALIGFLFYNFSPSRIFMGDTGSLLVGLISIVLAIKFIELNKFNNSLPRPIFIAAPATAVSVLIIPLFDTFRVFILRILQRRSPFSADRNHIHHRILKLGFSHLQATISLALTNILFIYLAIIFREFGNGILICLFLIVCMFINWVTTVMLRIKARKELKLKYLWK